MITPRVLPDTFPANRNSPTGCRLDTSLLSTAQQGAEHRSARKVTGMTPCVGLEKLIFVELFGTFEIISYLCNIVCKSLGAKRAVLSYEKGVFARL